jgi:predicted Zn finger-like uncharacterized protein
MILDHQAAANFPNLDIERAIMLITCPNCAARYLVADTVIGPSGRRVRCAACQQVWHQTAGAQDAKRDIVRASDPVPPTSFFPSDGAPPPSPPKAQESEPEAVARDDTAADDSPPFKRAPQRPASFDFDRTRARAAVMAQDISRTTKRQSNPNRRGWVVTLAIVGILVPLIIYLQLDAIRSILPAGWFAAGDGSRRTQANPELVAGLRIFYGQPTPVEQNGQRVLPINGTITNPTPASVPLPQMVGRLLDTEGREVHSWRFSPPVDSIRSGQTVTFETLSDKVPATAANLNIAFDTGQAN